MIPIHVVQPNYQMNPSHCLKSDLKCQVPKMEGVTEPYLQGYFLGVGFPLSRIHTAYIDEDSSILGT